MAAVEPDSIPEYHPCLVAFLSVVASAQIIKKSELTAYLPACGKGYAWFFWPGNRGNSNVHGPYH